VSTYFCVNVLNSEGISYNITAVQDSSAACKRYKYHKPQYKVTPSSPVAYLDNKIQKFKTCNETLKFQRDAYRSKNNAYNWPSAL